MVNCTKRVAKGVIGELKRKRYTNKEIWWWNNEVQEAIKSNRLL